MASGDDGPLPSPKLCVGQSSGGHFGSNRRRIFAGQQPAHAVFDLPHFCEPPPVRREQIRRLFVQPRRQFGYTLGVHFQRRRHGQRTTQLQRRCDALAAVLRQVCLPKTAGWRQVLQVVGVLFDIHQVQQRRVPQNDRACVVHCAPGTSDGRRYRRHVPLGSSTTAQPGGGQGSGRLWPVRIIRSAHQVEQSRGVDHRSIDIQVAGLDQISGRHGHPARHGQPLTIGMPGVHSGQGRGQAMPVGDVDMRRCHGACDRNRG